MDRASLGARASEVALELSTRERYANVYKCHVWPTLREVPLRELTAARLRVWQAELVKARVGAGTIHKARTFLSSVLRHAAESDAIPGNPLSVGRPPPPEQRDEVVPLAATKPRAYRAFRAVPLPGFEADLSGLSLA